MPRFLGSILSFIRKVTPLVVYACLAAAMLFDPGHNPLGVAGASFAVTLALGSVAFSYARTLKDGSAHRAEVVFGGERLVCGAVLFLIASIMKYASNDIPRYVSVVQAWLQAWLQPGKQQPDVTFFGLEPIGFMIGFVAFVFFLIALVYVQMGIVIVISIMGYRAKHRADHDKFFFTAKAYEQHLSDLEKGEEGPAPAETKPPEKPSTKA
jgi:hypothetical protein